MNVSKAARAIANRFVVTLGLLTIVALIASAMQAELKPEVSVHDPSVAKEGSAFYVFYTGPGVLYRTSPDLVRWTDPPKSVFAEIPAWAKEIVPKADWFWAPDAKYFGGLWHLYYCVSTFGSQVSVIGVATSPTLDPSKPTTKWTDQGMIVRSKRGDPYNAIDPSVLVDSDGSVWMTFGSWNKGLFLLELDPKTGLAKAGTTPQLIAQRGGPNAMEGPALVKRGKFYYLFMSWDLCCKGVDSTYNIRFGRAEKVAGPYRDVTGASLAEGGGTMLLGTYDDVIGPGGQEVLKDGDAFYLVHHYYEKKLNGFPMFQVRKLRWVDDWPVAEQPVGTVGERAGKENLWKLRWRHYVNFGAPSAIAFLPDGHLDDPKSRATWTLKGHELTMRWPQPNGHVFVDKVLLADDARSYIGYNEAGMTIFGVARPARP